MMTVDLRDTYSTNAKVLTSKMWCQVVAILARKKHGGHDNNGVYLNGFNLHECTHTPV